MSMLLFLLMVGYTRETSDARLADVRRIILVFKQAPPATNVCFFIKKTKRCW